MKKCVLLLLLVFVFVFSAQSAYSPWASFSSGCDIVFYNDDSWPSITYGVEVSLLSFTFGDWTIASPLRLESVTSSLPQNGTITMEHSKIKCGLGGEYRNKLFFISSYLYMGIIDYRELGGLGKEISIALTPGLQLEDHLALLFPLTYNHSSYYPSFSFQVAMKMGGKI
ncbi:MAG: hypothetical protein ACI4SL_00545 [Candidatus Ornithospirochaeta sp.]